MGGQYRVPEQQSVSVVQPYNAESSYKIYSVGYHPACPVWSGDDREYICFSYPNESVFCLFYEYHSVSRPVRRAYIVTVRGSGSAGNMGMGSATLPGVKTPVRCLAALIGHGFDNLRRGVRYLSEKDTRCFLLPDIFWYRFAALVEYDGTERRRRTLCRRDVDEFYMRYAGVTE